jgi:hypothetical protein
MKLLFDQNLHIEVITAFINDKENGILSIL